jgi:hypothetical protein
MIMRTKQQIFLHLSGFLLILILSVVAGHTDDRARDRASLRGIKSVVVKVHTFDREWASELATAGLTEAVLQATIEHQLEKSGIAVVSEEASMKNEDEGILNVRTTFSDPEPPKKSFVINEEEKLERFNPKKRYVYAIRLNLRQPASLKRKPEQTMNAITWQTESLGFRRVALIREDIENVVNVFIEAYLSENPKIKKAD